MIFGASFAFQMNIGQLQTLVHRKDYKELHILRKIFPRVPIMGLSATCGPHVLKDLISILGLKEVVPGEGERHINCASL